jgi:RNA polymerase sigma-70 factor (ECF subfamily)
MDIDDNVGEARRRPEPEDALTGDDWESQRRAGALEAIYDAHQPQLARFLRRRANPQDIGDLVQECFHRLAAGKTDFLSRIEKPGAYLARVARNLLTERAKADQRHFRSVHHEFLDAENAGPDPHAALEARDLMRRVEERLARLKPKTRDIFLMHRFEGMTYEEIAAATGMSEKGVEKQIAKAMTAILRVKANRR